MISGFDPQVREAAEAFVQRYDALAAQRTAVRALIATSDQTSQALVRVMRGWLGIVTRDVPGLDATTFVERIETPEDVVASALQLVDVVKQSAVVAAWRDALIVELEEQAARASSAQQQARRAVASMRELQAASREAGSAFQAQLVPLRRALRAVIGTTHPDYQALRASRVREAEDEDELSVVPLGTAAASPNQAAQPAASVQPDARVSVTNGHS